MDSEKFILEIEININTSITATTTDLGIWLNGKWFYLG
jgi:hypothetical protein